MGFGPFYMAQICKILDVYFLNICIWSSLKLFLCITFGENRSARAKVIFMLLADRHQRALAQVCVL